MEESIPPNLIETLERFEEACGAGLERRVAKALRPVIDTQDERLEEFESLLLELHSGQGSEGVQGNVNTAEMLQTLVKQAERRITQSIDKKIEAAVAAHMNHREARPAGVKQHTLEQLQKEVCC